MRFEITLGVPQKKKKNPKIKLSNDISKPLLVTYLKESKPTYHRDIYISMFIVKLAQLLRYGNIYMSIGEWMDKENIVYKHNGTLFNYE